MTFMLPSRIPSSVQLVLYIEEGQTADWKYKAKSHYLLRNNIVHFKYVHFKYVHFKYVLHIVHKLLPVT